MDRQWNENPLAYPRPLPVFDLKFRPDQSGTIAAIPVLGSLFVGAIAGAFFTNSSLGSLIGLAGGLICGLLIVGCIGVTSHKHWEARRDRIEQRLRKMRGRLDSVLHDDDDAAEEIALVAQKPKELTELLARCESTGTIIRLYLPREKTEPPVAPLRLPFEPVRLDESDSAFLALSSSATPDSPTAMPETHDTPDWLRPVLRARHLKQIGFWSIFPVIYIALFMRRSSPLVLMMLLGYAATAVSIWWFYVSPSSSFWVVPGGVIWPSKKRYYRAETGVLAWYPSSRTLWVADREQGASSRQVTPQEAELAMRAWLSPLPAPSEEMVWEFIGD